MMDCKKALGACGGDAEKVRLGEGTGLGRGWVLGVRGETRLALA